MRNARQQANSAPPAVAWTAFIATALVGWQIAQVTGFWSAKSAGVALAGATPTVAALVKARELSGSAGFIAAIVAYIAARVAGGMGLRWWGAAIGTAVGLVAAAIAGFAMGRN